jgi:hypothetical protein
MTLDTKFHVELVADAASPLDLTSASSRLSFVRQINMATGTAANQADKIWSDERTLTASSTEDLDLAGVLVDPFGATLTFARIKFLIVYALPANTNNVVLGNAASNGWVGPFGAATHTISIRPGGLIAMVAPDATAWPVTAGTGDLLHVANSGAGTGVTYDIALIGSSA